MCEIQRIKYSEDLLRTEKIHLAFIEKQKKLLEEKIKLIEENIGLVKKKAVETFGKDLYCKHTENFKNCSGCPLEMSESTEKFYKLF